MKKNFKHILLLFVIPVFGIIFFGYAPTLETKMIKDEFYVSIAKLKDWSDSKKTEEREFISRISFVEKCQENSAGDRELLKQLGVSEICETFDKFVYAQVASFILILIGLLHILISWTLSRGARDSQIKLIRNYKMGWYSAIALTLVILLGQSFLGAYTFFYLTVLLAKTYFPKLLFLILGGSLYAFYQVAKVLLKTPDLTTKELGADLILENEAPALWNLVKEVSSKLEVAPPTQILGGLSTAFYVTELPVGYSRGITSGRTLYLSIPLMKLLSPMELRAIIGHEMTHFKGQDTLVSRTLVPNIVKSEITMVHLSRAGIVAYPAMIAIGIFRIIFEEVISSFRRDRELAADNGAVKVTDTKIAAIALLRYAFECEAYNRALEAHLLNKGSLEQLLPLYQSENRQKSEFWQMIEQQVVPHPFDTHPPLSMRLKNFGLLIDDVKNEVCSPITGSAYDEVIGAQASILADAKKEYSEILQKAQDQVLVKSTSEIVTDANSESEKRKTELLEKHFPVKSWDKRGLSKVVGVLLFVLILILPPVLALVVADGVAAKVLASLVLALSMIIFKRVYINSRFKESLTLTKDGLKLGTWSEELKFRDIKGMNIISNNGMYQLIIGLNSKRGPLAKWPLIPWKRQNFIVYLHVFDGKQDDIAKDIFRYYLKELK